MRQFLASFIAFQVLTGSFSPLMKMKQRALRVAILSTIFSVLFAYQLYDYTTNKEDNLYELLELESPYVSSHQIDVGFDKAKTMYNPLENPEHQSRFDQIIAAQKCLKRTRCRDQYTRYNLSIDLPDDPNVEIDWRLGFTIIFYILFAFTQSVLANKEQKPGIRVAMGLGIMFCIDEIQLIQDVSAFIKEGQKSDPSVQRILSMFPQSYATFEIIMVSRLVYFLLFNIICTISMTYVINDDKERVAKSEEMRQNQQDMTKVINQIYKEIEGKEIDYSSEMAKKEYVYCKQRAMKQISVTMQALMTGKTKEELQKKPTEPFKAKLMKFMGLAFVCLLCARYIYTKQQQAKEGIVEDDF